jgi:N-acetyl-anhydromuramyl-L-alanine amidase AmpD
VTFSIDATAFVSPNHSARAKQPPSAIVLHTGEGTRQSDLSTLTKPNGSKSVSSHYYVCRDATIYQLVPDWREAWHAGVSEYLGFTNFNDFSIGIETEHKTGQNWPEVQRQALAWLCKLLITKYEIRRSMVVAHRWIAPGRKHDPSDWDDNGLMAWIEGLYVTDYAEKWGDMVYYFEGSGIEQAWRPLADTLGRATSNEHGDVLGRVWREFERGSISWQNGDPTIYLPRKA